MMEGTEPRPPTLDSRIRYMRSEWVLPERGTSADRERWDRFAPVEEMTSRQYHEQNGVSASGLKDLSRSFAHFVARNMEPREATPALDFGTCFHTTVLEPDNCHAVFAIGPDCRDRAGRHNRNMTEWKTFAAEAEKHELIALTPDEGERINAMAAAVRNHPYASLLLSPEAGPAELSGWAYHHAEGVTQWRGRAEEVDAWVLSKARPDRVDIAHQHLVDLKSTVSAGAGEFTRAVDRYQYDLQAAHYVAVWEALTGESWRFAFVAVEKEPPWSVGVYTLDEATMEWAAVERERLLVEFVAALDHHARTGEVRGIPPAPQVLSLKRWRRIG